MFDTIYPRICNWNAERYEQEFDKALSIQLITEEFEEWLKALSEKNEVEQVDALCDLIYVAFGIIWKKNPIEAEVDYNAKQANIIISTLMTVDELPGLFIATSLLAYGLNEEYSDILFAQFVIQAAATEMFGMGFEAEDITEAMTIVCDSNDSKVATKTASNVKANIDKGENFIAPEPRLRLLLEKVNARHN